MAPIAVPSQRRLGLCNIVWGEESGWWEFGGVILEFLPGLRCSFSVTFGDANTRELAGVECLYRVGLVLIGLDGKNTLSFLPLLTAHKRQKMPPLPRHPNLLFFIFLPFSTYSTTFIL